MTHSKMPQLLISFWENKSIKVDLPWRVTSTIVATNIMETLFSPSFLMQAY